MTDAEIIKILERITKLESKHDAKNDTIDFMKGIFDLIKRQQAEIADLNTYIKQLDIEHRYELKHVVNDTIETFTEKLKELYEIDGIITDDMKVPIGVIRANIDDIVEEMVGTNDE